MKSCCTYLVIIFPNLRKKSYERSLLPNVLIFYLICRYSEEHVEWASPIQPPPPRKMSVTIIILSEHKNKPLLIKVELSIDEEK